MIRTNFIFNKTKDLLNSAMSRQSTADFQDDGSYNIFAKMFTLLCSYPAGMPHATGKWNIS